MVLTTAGRWLTSALLVLMTGWAAALVGPDLGDRGVRLEIGATDGPLIEGPWGVACGSTPIRRSPLTGSSDRRFHPRRVLRSAVKRERGASSPIQPRREVRESAGGATREPHRSDPTLLELALAPLMATLRPSWGERQGRRIDSVGST